ncbi:Rho GTPase activation protein [Polychytrium aggregatum]|uniref:Rho GTPase activation protein n=1 Tax=Polychytrium aggregatum TaxID=110093 RepID=UPI0022FEE6A6|nr:Rho GTPase activation protein [Polychytrium aggregatum]KAI9202008.1 Rho GTPase activation protein [Polychytrium aggregatum]
MNTPRRPSVPNVNSPLFRRPSAKFASAEAAKLAGGSKAMGDKRISMAALLSLASENDAEVDDALTKAQRKLRELKGRISSQSKRNFLLERDVRYLDSRIALLIQNRMALDEQQEVASALEEAEAVEGSLPDDRRRQLYGNLFFLLQSEPRHIAVLARLVSLSEIDTLLQTVMFTIYGNQYESREEFLLLSMFQNVLAHQFETAADFGNLMRANTPVSRMMTTYTRRGPGQTYLKTVLSERINHVIESVGLDLEINPLKVYEQMIIDIETTTGEPCNLPRGLTMEAAAANPDVKAILAPRHKTLTDVANSFLATIIDSIEQVPYGIRWICKQIKSLTKRKFPDATDENLCTLIGGFFMLRFVNPSIVTPQAYMLVESTPQKHPRRTLTLVAKMLQNVANKATYSKEPYMLELNPFVEENRASINKFLLDLCDVPDFFEALEMEQYIALSKKEIQLHINLNEIYNTHALLLQHLDALAPNPKHHLRVCLEDLGPAPAQVSRSENKSIILPLFSRWETPINDTLSTLGDGELTQTDLIYMDTKAHFVHILRTLPNLIHMPGFTLLKAADNAASSRDQTLMKKGLKARELLRQLEELGVIDPKDGHKLIIEEIKQELEHLGNLRETINKEIGSLEIVFKTILDHNNYLRNQLESYKTYLQNVRMQSGIQKTAKPSVQGPITISHTQLEKDGVIVESNIPENRRSQIFFNIISPVSGTFVITLNFKGRTTPILEMDLKLDDLLEKQKMGVELLDLEYVQLSVNKILVLIRKNFLKGSK